MTDEMIHFCFLKADKNEEGLRPVISRNIEDLGITHQQAMDVCIELEGKETIAAWLTGPTKIFEDDDEG